MVKTFKNTLDLLKLIKSRVKGKTKVFTLDEILILIPEKKRVKDILGILRGKVDKSSIDLVREERQGWR